VLPHINAAVELAGTDGVVYHAAVLFIGETYVALSRPEEADEEFVPTEEQFELSWAGANGLLTVPVRTRERLARGGGHVLWETTPIGETTRIQRRDNVRIPVNRRMTIANLDGPTGESERAMLRDVSEVALRCSVRNLDWLEAEAGTHTRVRFTISEDEEEFVSYAHVHLVREVKEGKYDVAHVVVIFDAKAPWKNDLRAAIFAEQRKIAEQRRQFHEQIRAEEAAAHLDVPETPPHRPDPERRHWWSRRA
jgi:hypothetical protein